MYNPRFSKNDAYMLMLASRTQPAAAEHPVVGAQVLRYPVKFKHGEYHTGL